MWSWEDYGKGLEWDATKSLLSTPGVVTAHPETALIQFLLENLGAAPGEAYIACSRVPCYASVRYVDAVNRTGKGPTFTVSTANPDWCRLDVAEPWILPEGASRAVVATLRELMLRDLGVLLYYRRHNPFKEDSEEYDEDGGDDDENDQEDTQEENDDGVCGSDTDEEELSEL
ncbi:hypothetical protein V8D89_008612 [Ganoderma adspersum]